MQVPDITRGGQGRSDRRGGEGRRLGGRGGLQDHLRAAQHPGERGEGAEDVRGAGGGDQEGTRLVQEGEHAEGLGPRVVQLHQV